MTRRRNDTDRIEAIDLLDEAVRRLRAAPWSVHLFFQAGGLPFVLGLLVFVVDMRRSALAPRHAGEAALLMALLYLWMKGWHALAADRLRAAPAGERPALRPAAAVRRFLDQAAIQPWSLFALPVGLVLTLPFAWVYAYFHARTLTDDPSEARAQAVSRPMENHVLVLLLSLAAFVVWLNLLAVVLALPSILASLLGIETPYSRSPMLLFDSTLLLAVTGLAWLVTAPVAHAAYLVRAERAEAASTGADLLREIDTLPAAAGGRIVACLLAVLLAAATGSARASEPSGAVVAPAPAPAAAPPIAADDLDRAVRGVVARPEFLWRMPRPEAGPGEEEPGVIGRFVRSIVGLFKDGFDALARAVERFYRWLEKLLRPHRPADESGGKGPAWPIRASWLILAGLVVVGAAAIAYWWRRRPPATEVRATAVVPSSRADVGTAAPSDAPSDEWRDRARELLDRGELRLAVRAMHLAILALLGEARLLTLGRSKSDRDYLFELRRRRPDRPEMADLFQDGVLDFERVWYGTHPATAGLVLGLGERCDALRRHAKG